MTVSNVSASGVDVTQLLQALVQRRSAAAVQNAQPAGPPSPPSLDDIENRLEKQAQVAGIDVSKLHALRPKIESAVTGALKNYANSDDTSDPMEIVRNAIETTLKENGIDPQQLQDQFGGGPGGPGGAGGPPPGGGPGGPPPGGGPGAGSGPSGPPPQRTDASRRSSADIQEVKQKILAAIEASKDGTIDLSALFSDLPVGSGVNVQV
jgi:hypothetical protein